MNRATWIIAILLTPICCCLGRLPNLIGPPPIAPEEDHIVIRRLPTFTPTPAGDPSGAGGSSDADATIPSPGGSVTAVPHTSSPNDLPPTAAPTIGLPTGAATFIPLVTPTITATLFTQPISPLPLPSDDDDDDDDDDDNDSSSSPKVTDTPTATPLPVVSFSAQNYRVNEADGAATITVTLNIPPGQPVAVDYATADETAIAGEDYMAITGTLIFEPGQTSQTFSVSIRDDAEAGECPPEAINLTLSNPSRAIPGLMTATLLIIDADSLMVTTTDDADDGGCDQMHCSLREAIKAANVQPGADTICFNIPSGPYTIQPSSPLPAITDPVAIDGITQPGAACDSWPPALLIELDGSQAAGPDTPGLRITAGHSTVRGLVINRFPGNGLELATEGYNRIRCNYIGVDITGAKNLGNTETGLYIDNIPNNIVGGTTSTARNLISGNSSRGVSIEGGEAVSNTVIGNYIGTDSSGTQPLGNRRACIRLGGGATGNTIGGPTDPGLTRCQGACNLLAASVDWRGVAIEEAHDNLIQGNYIGVNVAGTKALRNAGEGIDIRKSSSNRIEGNIIGGNNSSGIHLIQQETTGNLVVGNFIGTNRTGAIDLGNQESGIHQERRASNNTIIGNRIAYNKGGGLKNERGNLTVTGNRIISNTNPTSGGGIFNSGVLTMTDTTISGNTAASGGGLFNAGAGRLTLTRSTISGNAARQDGGGLYNTGQMLTIDNSTLSGNTGAAEGTGLFNGDDGVMAVFQSTVYSNVSSTAAFDPATSFNVGDFPRFATVADFNQDGRLDLTTVYSFSNNVTVLLGTDSGGFGPGVQFGAGRRPVFVVVRDFNQDGRPDLAVANRLSDDVSVLLGDGNGGVKKTTNFKVGDRPEFIAAEDLDDNQCLDLVTANRDSNTVSVLAGDCAGSFKPAVHFDVGQTWPRSVAVGDFDGDGRPDLATANNISNTVSILLGDGQGRFALLDDFATVGNAPIDAAAGDFDGDGRPDLVTADHLSDRVSVLWGRGDGTFEQPPDTYDVEDGPRNVAVGDLNGDGRPDLTVTNYHANNVSVLLGRGDRTFEPPASLDVETGPESMEIRDFNDDGRPDLIVTNNLSDSVSILLNKTGGTIGADSGAVTFQNSIIAAPAGVLCPPDSGAIISGGYNLTGDNSCDAFLSDVTNITNTDPLLDPLQVNGGPTETHALRPGSPAIDAGSCPGSSADQRGFLRPVDLPPPDAADGCDMGAYEAQQP